MTDKTHNKLQKVGTVVGIAGGVAGLGLTIFQTVCFIKDRKAMKAQIEDERKSVEGN